MATKRKLGSLPGASAWEPLESAGHVKKLLAWLIHSIRDQTIDPKTAAIMGQLGCFLLKATEVHDIEQRLETLERNENIRQKNGIPRVYAEVSPGTLD